MFKKRNSVVLESLRRVETVIRGPSKSALRWEACSQTILEKKLETALKSHRVDEAWDVFKDFKRLYGFPDNRIMNRFVTVLSYSSDSGWLRKADEMTRMALNHNKSCLISGDALIKLLLSLARAQIPESACNILVVMLQRRHVLNPDVLRLVFMHMVKTEVGTCLASNYLVYHPSPPPDTVLFNLVLASCVRFGFSLKGQELIELMAKVHVVADAHSIVIMSFIYEMNGMRDELQKLKDQFVLAQVPPQLLGHYRHLFDNLLSLEFKFDDLPSAVLLVLDICSKRSALGFGSEKPRVLPLGSHHIRSGLKIQISPKLLLQQRDSSLSTEATFVNYQDSKLGITNKTLAKLVYGYKRHDNLPELSKLLFTVGGFGLCAHVIDACVATGCLETAHNILDDMDSAGHTMELDTYRKVLTGYQKSKMLTNAQLLLRQMTKAGLITDPSNEIIIIMVPDDDGNNNKNTDLRDLLLQEIKGGEQMQVPPRMLYQLNSSLYYFCKAKMLGDAVITFRKIQKMKIPPTRQNFWILMDMYSSLGMYREITVLWGDIKRNIASNNIEVTQDLLEKLVVNFLKGGYFERVMEVISYIKDKDMYNDLIMYKNEYLKLHKNLYRSLRASDDAVTEAQAIRIQHVKALRKLVGVARNFKL